MPKPTRILHVCRWYAPHRGGVETHVAAVSAELIEQGYVTTVICEQDRADEPLSEIINGVQVYRIELAAVKNKLSVWNWIKQHQHLFDGADIIQVHDVFWWVLPIYVSIRQKVFMTFHGWEGQYPVRWQAKLQRWWWNQLSVASLHVGEWIQEFYWDKPDVITYGGVTLEKNNKKSASKNEFKVVFLGRLEPENSVASYIELVKILKKEIPKLKMMWAGDGALRSQCEQVGMAMGIVAEPSKYIDAADLVLSASYLSILSAQAKGKIVASLYDHDLKKRYLETYPGRDFLLLSESPKKLADEILKLKHNSRSWLQKAAAAQKFAATQTWYNVSKQYQDLWQK